MGLLLIARLFNPGHPGRVIRMPYESGMDPVHDTRRRFDVRFHLLAIAFLVFDVELFFLFPWAVASHPAESNMSVARAEGGNESRGAASDDRALPALRRSASVPRQGIDAAVAKGLVENRHLVFGGAMTFVVLLTLGYVYDWRKGVFRWR